MAAAKTDKLSLAAQALEDDMNAVAVRDQRKAANLVKVDDDYRELSFEDTMARFASDYGTEVADAADVLGDGFNVIAKDDLINRHLFIINWLVSDPKNEQYGTPYVVVKGITKDGTRFRFTDGSQYGIAGELVALAMSRAAKGHPAPNGGLELRKGLKRDDVEWTNEATGETGTGKIYRAAL